MSEKHLATGSTLPPITKDTLRLYSMRFCPYAQTTRMVLAHKQILYEKVHVNLKKKPEWLLERNPLGLVPVLEFNNEVVYESAICDEYLDEKYPDNKLLPDDPYQRARAKILMDGVAKVIKPFHTLGRGTDEEKAKSKEDLLTSLDRYEKALTGKFFGGESPNMVDVRIWPWVERFPVAKQLTGFEILAVDRFPKLKQWADDMMETPMVKAECLTTEQHARFIVSSFMAGTGEPEYDPA